MALAIYTKDPAAILDYQIDWSDWLIEDTIATPGASSVWTGPAGMTQVTASKTTTTTTIRLSGGTHGTDYEWVNHIITTGGQEDERSIIIQVRQQEAGASVDATDRANALTILSRWIEINIAPVLEQSRIEEILDDNKRASVWASLTAYTPGDVIHPTVSTGRRYRCIVGGTSEATEPFTGNDRWPVSQGAQVTEGTTLTWQEDGPAYSNLYDIRQAAYECWDDKVSRSTQFIQAGELHMEMVYSHCVKQRDNFTPMGFA